MQRGEDARRLAHEAGLEHASRSDLDLIRTLLSVRAIMKSRPRVLLDVGAHRGVFAKYAAKILGCCRAECFEADKDLLDELRLSLREIDNVIHEIALSNRSGRADFYVHGSRGMSSLLTADPKILATKFPGAGNVEILCRDVPIATLDSYTCSGAELSSERYFLKIDTQGNELQVLEGAQETLCRTDGCLIEYMFCTP